MTDKELRTVVFGYKCIECGTTGVMRDEVPFWCDTPHLDTTCEKCDAKAEMEHARLYNA